MNLDRHDEARPLRVLVVCTANICRSPVAERLIERHLQAIGLPVVVRSAGTHGGRLPVHENTMRAARDLDVDLSDHRSRALTRPLVVDDGSDLVVTMTRDHLRHVAALEPTAWPRSFTLKELVRRANGVPRAVDDLSEWIASAGAGRRAADMIHASPLDDLDDPYGRPLGDHRKMVADVDGLARSLAANLARVRL